MLDQVQNFVMNHLPAASGVAVVLVDVVLRLVKSEKPLSIAHAVASVAHKLSDILGGVANFLDKVLPQKVKK